MGAPLSKVSFTAEETEEFISRLGIQKALLVKRLADPQFGGKDKTATIGHELELVIVDHAGRPLRINDLVIGALQPQGYSIVREMMQHQLELNGSVQPLSGKPFTWFRVHTTQVLQKINTVAACKGGQTGLFGILPTMTKADTSERFFSTNPRYHAINDGLRRIRPKFDLALEGKHDKLHLVSDNIGIEGVNTSLQVHLSVPPAEAALFYNAAQVATALAVAACGNSPLLFRRHLWQESRIKAFKAATRDRAFFGSNWLPSIEAYLRAMIQLPPVIPEISGEPNTRLKELTTHLGAVWPWNRLVFGDDHVRIEFRALPSGPTVYDMAANFALIIGLTLAIKEYVGKWISDGLDFGSVNANFYAAARYGLEARFAWPVGNTKTVSVMPVRGILFSWIPEAEAALRRAGIHPAEAAHYLDIIHNRVKKRKTGADWLGHTFTAAPGSIIERTQSTTLRYLQLSQNGWGPPVHTWNS